MSDSPAGTTVTPVAPFFINGASRVGQIHLVDGEHQGTGNQDSFGYRSGRHGIIAITVDGCGSTSDSGAGARAAVRILLNLGEELLSRDQIPAPEECARHLQAELLKRILASATPIAREGDAASLNDVLGQSYLFTLLIALVTPTWTAVLGCGDGIWAVNGVTKKIEPRADNKPEYLTYSIMTPPPKDFGRETIKVLHVVDDLLGLHSLLLATDGAEPLMVARPFADGTAQYGTAQSGTVQLSDLWATPRFREEGAVAAMLDVIANSSQRLVAEPRGEGAMTVRLDYRPNPCDDDVTVLCLVRNSAVSLPQAWVDYRTKYGPKPVAQAAGTAAPTASSGTMGAPAMAGAASPQGSGGGSAATASPLPAKGATTSAASRGATPPLVTRSSSTAGARPVLTVREVPAPQPGRIRRAWNAFWAWLVSWSQGKGVKSSDKPTQPKK